MIVRLWSELWLPEMAFLRCAIAAGLLSSIALGIVGTLVVTRRISSIAGAVSHAALGGVGIALFLQRVWLLPWCTPTLGAVIGAVFSALAVGLVNLYAKEREDTVIAVVWALGMSIGLLFLDKTPGYVDLQGYLFGNILLLTPGEVALTGGLDLLILIPTVLFFNLLLASSFDAEFARLRGVRTAAIQLIVLTMTALTIVLMIHMVGIILVIALLTLPAATAGCFTRRLATTMVLAGVLNAVFVTAGLLASCFFELPSGPVIVLLAALIYVLALLVRRFQAAYAFTHWIRSTFNQGSQK